VRLKALGKLKKNPMTSPGIKPTTSRLVAQCLNHYATVCSLTFSTVLDYSVTIYDVPRRLNGDFDQDCIEDCTVFIRRWEIQCTGLVFFSLDVSEYTWLCMCTVLCN
jgi:hypothetical protein